MIIEATAEYASPLAAMHGACFAEAWTAPDIARLMAMPGARTLIALDEQSEPVAFLLARVAADEAEIITVATLAHARRQGWARRLIRRLVPELRGLNVRHLFIEVAESNVAGQELYASLGFEAAGERRGYYSRPDAEAENAIVMRLDL